MKFATILNTLATASPVCENTITDGLLTCKYSEIPGITATIGQYLLEQGVSLDDCLAVECTNTLPGALFLLYLLQKEQGFVLLPPSEKKEADSELKPVPKFCHYKLRILPVSKQEVDHWQANPALYLAVEQRTPDSIPEADTRGKLFLRTSGSMGTAKLVVHTHEGLLGNAGNSRDKYQFSAEDRVTIPVPIFHMYGFGAEFLPAVLVGASIDLQQNTNLLKYLDRERHFKPTIAFITPNLCEMLLQGKRTPTHYKVMVVSGQRFRDDLFQALDPLCGGRLVNQYGSSEMGAMAACDPGDDFEKRIATIGKPMPGVELKLENIHEGIGELYCRHPYGYMGYMNEDGQWLSRASEWQRTGDIARLLENGDMTVVGRADDSVNRSGYLILLADIEKRMATLDGISSVTVLATDQIERIQGQHIMAFCLTDTGVSLNPEDIKRACAGIMPRHAVPDEIHIVEQLPLLPSGKVDRQALLALSR